MEVITCHVARRVDVTHEVERVVFAFVFVRPQDLGRAVQVTYGREFTVFSRCSSQAKFFYGFRRVVQWFCRAAKRDQFVVDQRA